MLMDENFKSAQELLNTYIVHKLSIHKPSKIILMDDFRRFMNT